MSCNFFSSLYIISGGGVRRYSILQQLNSLTISWKILKNTILIHYYYPFYKKTLFWKSSYTTGSTHLFVIFSRKKCSAYYCLRLFMFVKICCCYESIVTFLDCCAGPHHHHPFMMMKLTFFPFAALVHTHSNPYPCLY